MHGVCLLLLLVECIYLYLYNGAFKVPKKFRINIDDHDFFLVHNYSQEPINSKRVIFR